ncbi:MAG: response regulator transcription factor [Bacteroidia bacterium]
MAAITLFVADDHPLFLKGLINTLKDEPGFTILGSANNGKTALKAIKMQQPHVAILDLDMPEMNGIEVAKILVKEQPVMKVIILSMHKEADIIKAAMALGIHAYIFKDDAVLDLVNGIRTVMNGEVYISETKHKNIKTFSANDNELLQSLTRMERIVLDLIAQQKSTKEIADELFLSVKTVENHRTHISQKLLLKGNNSLLKFALQMNAAK